jgi:hypothetical protein
MCAAMGLDHPSQLSPSIMVKRVNHSMVQSFAEIYQHYDDNSLLNGTAPERFQRLWDASTAEVFSPPVPQITR